MQKYNIICLSNQLWSYPLWTNKKHVMSRLAKQGHNVLFVDPPINTQRLFLNQLLEGKWPINRLINKTYKDMGLTVYSPLKLYSSDSLEDTFLAQKFTQKITSISKKIFDPTLPTILWIYNVEIRGLKQFVENLPHDVLVYDCVDNYVGFPKYDTPEKKEWLLSQEEYLTQKANLVFSTAPEIYERLSKINPKTYYTPNVGDYEKFKNVHGNRDLVPEEMKSLRRPIIGFTGALDTYKFDATLVKRAALDFPNYTFVLIGTIALKDRDGSLEELGLSNIPNIHFLGAKDYSIVQNYFAGFDAYIIPYVLNDYTIGGCFPVKFHDALAAGLATIVTDMPAYMPFSNVCYISKNYDDFSQNIKKAIDEDSDAKVKERQLVAKQNNWEGKVSSMLKYIQDFRESQ